MNVQPVQGKLFFDWAVTNIDPGLEGLEAGKLPKGAVVGQNSFGKQGYEICPQRPETLIFALYALSQHLPAERGFDPHELRDRILKVSRDAGLLAVVAR